MKQHGDEKMFFTEPGAFDRATFRPRPPVAPRRKPGFKWSVLLMWSAFFLALSAVVWVTWEVFGSSNSSVPRGLTTFKSDKPYLDEEWFRKFVGLDNPDGELPSLQEVENKLIRLEQIRSVTVSRRFADNGVDVVVRERTPCMRLLMKDENGREEVRYVDSEGEENPKPESTREERAMRAIYRAEGYSSAFVETLPWLSDSRIVSPPVSVEKEVLGNSGNSAGNDRTEKAVAPRLPLVWGGEQLALFAHHARTILPEESPGWLRISAKAFRGGFYDRIPGDSIRVWLDPARQPFRVPEKIWVQQVVFSANSERFMDELARYARPGFRVWVGEELMREAWEGAGRANVFDLCIGEEPDVANLRPNYGQSALFSSHGIAPGTASAASHSQFVRAAPAHQL